MEIRRAVLGLVAAVCLVPVCADEKGAASTSAAAAPMPRSSSRVVHLTRLPYLITEPGAYRLDRDWNLDSSPTYSVIEITASDVVLDLRGFSIFYAGDGNIVQIEGNHVAVKNGRLASVDASAISSSGSATTVEGLRVAARNGLALLGDHAALRDSEIASTFGVQVAEHSIVERNAIACCIALSGDGNAVLDNRLGGGLDAIVEVHGDDNLVAGNIIEGSFGLSSIVTIGGDRNVSRDNTILLPEVVQQGPIIAVEGTGNTLDGNIAVPQSGDLRARIGVAFSKGGNYFGDNRMAADVPFDLANTMQTDWGGNVGF